MLIEDIIDHAARTGDISGAVDALLMEIRGYTPWSSEGSGSRGKGLLHHALVQRHGLSQTGDKTVFKLDDKQQARRSNPVYRKEWRQYKEKQGRPPLMFNRRSKPQYGIHAFGSTHPHHQEPTNRSLGL